MLVYQSLSLQIQKVVLALGDYMGAQCHACIGGTNVREDMQKLSDGGIQVVVGTPGRVFDMINRRSLGKYCFIDAFYYRLLVAKFFHVGICFLAQGGLLYEKYDV